MSSLKATSPDSRVWSVPFRGLILLRCRKVDQPKAIRPSVNNKKRSSTDPTSRRGRRRRPKQKAIRSFVGTKGPNECPDWKVQDLTALHRPLAYVKRMSNKFMGTVGPYQVFRFPYYDRWGMNTGEQMYTGFMTLPQAYTCHIATKIRRLQSYVRRSNKIELKHKAGLRSIAAKVAILCFLHGSDYLAERFRALAPRPGRKGTKVLNSMVRKFTSKLSDNKWFVYRHTFSNVKWLDLRGNCPRDKLKVYRSTKALADKFGRVVDDRFVGIYRGIHQTFVRNGLYLV